MCGVAGWFHPAGMAVPERVQKMRDAMAYRGPDDAGLATLDSGHLVLAHRRLAILDLSPLGHQPMAAADGRHWIVFNGEVYNFRQLRAELALLGHCFRSESDTEVVLAAWQQWGAAGFQRFRGMFALAIFDVRERRLILARDRFGVKPLYYCLGSHGIAFGSELRALLAGGFARRTVDAEALAEYLQFGYISAPRAILGNVRTLLPGEILEFDSARQLRSTRYWDTTQELLDGRHNALRAELERLPEAELLQRGESLLAEAFGLRLIADVPVGLFLSGGVDSSLVAALLARRCGAQLRTFTIGFTDREFDESRYAREVAAQLGTQHTERILDAGEALRLCGRIPEVFDEPMADSSCLPTLLVCQLAREQVKVALSADGADELFGGYARYRVVGRLLQQRRRLGVLLSLGAGVLNAVPTSWLALAYRAGTRAAGQARYAAIEDKITRVKTLLAARSEGDAYVAAVNAWSRARVQCLTGAPGPAQAMEAGALRNWNGFPADDPRAQAMHFDTTRYLTGDLLTKVDRTSMSVALESREPFLDQEILRFAAALPMAWRIRGGSGKHLLKRLLAQHFPAGFFDRPKQGFSAPIASWLRGPLREALQDTLSPARVRARGLLDADAVQAELQGFLRGRSVASGNGLWTLYQLQCWADRWLAPETGGAA